MSKTFIYIKTEPFIYGLEYFVLSAARALSALYNWAQTAQRMKYQYQILPGVLRSRKSLGIPGEIPGKIRMIVRLHTKGVSFSGIKFMKGWDFTIQSIRKGTEICHFCL